MTVETTTRSIDYTSGTELTVTFPFLEDTDLVVVDADGEGNETTLTMGEDEDYVVSGAGNPNGGTVTLAETIAEGHTVTVSRTVSLTQETDLRNAGRLLPSTIETALDKATMALQQVTGAQSETAGTLSNFLLTWPSLVEAAVTSALGGSLEEMVAEAVEDYLEEHPASGSCRTIWFLDHWDGGLTGTEDATTAIRAAVAAALAAGAELVFPGNAIFLVSDSIDITGVKVRGGGACNWPHAPGLSASTYTGTSFYFSGVALSDCFWAETGGPSGLRGLTVSVAEAEGGNGCSEYGIRALNVSNFSIEDVAVFGANTRGVFLRGDAAWFPMCHIRDLSVWCNHVTDIGLWAYGVTLNASNISCLEPSKAGVALTAVGGTINGLSLSSSERWCGVFSQCTLTINGLNATSANAAWAGIVGAEGCTINGLSLHNTDDVEETPSRALLLNPPCNIQGAVVSALAIWNWATANVSPSADKKHWVSGQAINDDGYIDLVVTTNTESQDVSELFPELS